MKHYLLLLITLIAFNAKGQDHKLHHEGNNSYILQGYWLDRVFVDSTEYYIESWYIKGDTNYLTKVYMKLGQPPYIFQYKEFMVTIYLFNLF